MAFCRRPLAGSLLALLLLMPAAASAQTVNGAITGVVKDASGAVVKDVALTLRNVATDQLVGTTMSGAQGEYAFRNLAPAKYAVDALKDGFQQITQSDIEVTLSSIQRVEITLTIGAPGWLTKVGIIVSTGFFEAWASASQKSPAVAFAWACAFRYWFTPRWKASAPR